VNKEDFVCIYCSARLKEERIEKIKIFRRIEENWTNPESKGWKRLLLVFTNPSRAFWDITHYREKIGSFKIIPIIALLFGLLGVVSVSHFDFSVSSLVPPALSVFLFYLSTFLMFFLFGLIYYTIFILFSSLLFSFGANQSINLSKQMKLRYGGRKKDKEGEEGEKTKTMIEAEGGYTAELPEYLTTESKKTAITLYAFAPLLVSLIISVLIAWIALPSVPVDFYMVLNPGILDGFVNSAVWGIIDWIQIIILIGWVPILMSIALRDIANASTTRVYISSLIVAVLISLVVYFSRSTLFFLYMSI
jgi:hypothetical protein